MEYRLTSTVCTYGVSRTSFGGRQGTLTVRRLSVRRLENKTTQAITARFETKIQECILSSVRLGAGVSLPGIVQFDDSTGKRRGNLLPRLKTLSMAGRGGNTYISLKLKEWSFDSFEMHRAAGHGGFIVGTVHGWEWSRDNEFVCERVGVDTVASP